MSELQVSPFHQNSQVRRKIIHDVIQQRETHIGSGHTAENDAKAGIWNLIFKAAGSHLGLAINTEALKDGAGALALNREQVIKAVSILISVVEIHDLEQIKIAAQNKSVGMEGG